ncbi:hypothetical protein ABZP36_025945 [Zizania latifolia]
MSLPGLVSRELSPGPSLANHIPLPPKSKAAAQSVAVGDLFTALNRHIQAGEFPQAVKFADQGNPAVLAVAPVDEDAMRCKVVAHIRSDATEMALAAIRAAERPSATTRIGKEELMVEDYGDNEIEYELAPVSAQLAYVCQLQGQIQEAMEAYTNMTNWNLADPSSLAVATANKLQLIESLEFKLSPRQKEALYSAHVLLLLHANKTDQKAGVLGRYAEKHPENSKGVLLALAQIAATANHFQIAADSNGASSVLDSVIQWWKNSMTEDNKLDVFIWEAATFKLNHGRDEESCQLYEELVNGFGSTEALAGLVAT